MTKLAIINKGETLDEAKIKLVRDTIAKGASEHEFEVFVATCNRLRLDPFARQIFLVKRWDAQLKREVASAQVSIDGLRLVAERTGQYRGQTTPQWCGRDGQWVDVWLSSEPPAAARCGVYRDGFVEPLLRVARYDSYAQTTKDGQPNRMWRVMPDVMLSKCAESLSLRAAFPNELSGVYTQEEMGQAANDRAKPQPHAPRRTLDDVAANPALEADVEYDVMGEVLEPVVDEFGLPTPAGDCPVVRGRPLSDVPPEKLEQWYTKSRDTMDPRTRDWCEYLVLRAAHAEHTQQENGK